jgi:uncharacterized protein
VAAGGQPATHARPLNCVDRRHATAAASRTSIVGGFILRERYPCYNFVLICECCNVDLPPESAEAPICSFECAICLSCAEGALESRCPNCGGELVTPAPAPGREIGKVAAFNRAGLQASRLRKTQGIAVQNMNTLENASALPSMKTSRALQRTVAGCGSLTASWVSPKAGSPSHSLCVIHSDGRKSRCLRYSLMSR